MSGGVNIATQIWQPAPDGATHSTSRTGESPAPSRAPLAHPLSPTRSLLPTRFLSPTRSLPHPRQNLGTSYVRVMVERTIRLTNLTNIDTEYEWKCHIQSGSASIKCSPASGLLKGGEAISVTVQVIPSEAGLLEALVGCELHRGFAKPIGFSLRSEVQGLTILYQVHDSPEGPPGRTAPSQPGPHARTPSPTPSPTPKPEPQS